MAAPRIDSVTDVARKIAQPEVSAVCDVHGRPAALNRARRTSTVVGPPRWCEWMDTLLLDAPVGGWAGGWGTLSEVVASPCTQSPPQPTGEEGELGDSPQAATHLLRLSEGFVAGDSPKVSPAPHAHKANRKVMRAKLKPLAETSPAQLNRRLKLGTVSRSELEHDRKQCDHCDNKVEIHPTEEKYQGAVENAPSLSEQATPEKQSRERDEDNHMPDQPHSKAEQTMQSPSLPSTHVDECTKASQRPGTAGSIREFSIPIDSTPWSIDSAELANGAVSEEQIYEHPGGGPRRSRGRAAPRTPSATSTAPEFRLDGCTPPEHGASPSVLVSPDSTSNNGSAKQTRRRVASAGRTSVLSRPASRGSSLQSPAGLASAAVESALGRLEVQRPNSREAVAVAREVRSEMNRWLRNVDPKVPHHQLQARARSRVPVVQSIDCSPLSSTAPKQAAGWVPYEQRTEGASVERSRRSLTPSSYPSLSAARARQREQGAEALGAALGPARRTTRSAQSDARHSVSLPNIGGLRRGQVSQAAAEFQRKTSRAIPVHDRPQWGRAQHQQPKKVPGRLRRATAPWAGLSAVPTVGAVMSAMR
eukprot:COSAG02_NODE_142_length_34188_cov_183.180791_15_plen_590_part_00